ncbi:MAG: copper chaperone PCu(A)C [Gammaproteobacteria bacterium]|nr:copper chaperone PCu(A)C [Gammaproteobacteria bacterium]NND59525.1 copper chaperone PCu(A)C [Gammaproteobacteria bacterium]
MRTCLLSIILMLTGCAPRPAIEVTGAWVRQPPPHTSATAGYLQLTNNSGDTVVLAGARSPHYGRVMIHRTTTADGVTTMRHATPLRVGDSETVVFEPGGLHVMLMQPRHSITDGDEVVFELLFAEREPLTVTAVVRAP